MLHTFVHGCLGAQTVSAVTCLFLAMAVYPHVLVKAHAELDSVVGRDQLPDFTHQADLPYIRAIMLELLRWQPVVPLGKILVCR